jgi:hypothetical protein
MWRDEKRNAKKTGFIYISDLIDIAFLTETANYREMTELEREQKRAESGVCSGWRSVPKLQYWRLLLRAGCGTLGDVAGLGDAEDEEAG